MKKILSALLAALMLLSVTACAAHEPVLPPSRWGKSDAQGMLPYTYSLSEAYDAAEVVALVTVGGLAGGGADHRANLFPDNGPKSVQGGYPP